MSFNANHPECLPGEMFITNADDSIYHYIGWKTKRMGVISYTESGEPCRNMWPGSFPVFVLLSEINGSNPDLQD